MDVRSGRQKEWHIVPSIHAIFQHRCQPPSCLGKVEERVSLLAILNTVNAVAGAVLFVCPWVLSYEGSLLASINAWIAGLALTVLAVAAATDIWPKLNLVCLSIGVWIFAAPWLLDFSNNADPATSHLAAGAIAILVSLVCLGGRWLTRPYQ